MTRKRVLRVPEVALDLFGDEKAAWRVYELVKDGKIPSLRLSKRTIYIPVERYEQWKREEGLAS